MNNVERRNSVNKEKFKYSLLCLMLFLIMPLSASANMVWPSLYIAEGMRSWYVILIGLLIEIIFVKFYLKESYLKSVLIAFIMNLASTVLETADIQIRIPLLEPFHQLRLS